MPMGFAFLPVLAGAASAAGGALRTVLPKVLQHGASAIRNAGAVASQFGAATNMMRPVVGAGSRLQRVLTAHPNAAKVAAGAGGVMGILLLTSYLGVLSDEEKDMMVALAARGVSPEEAYQQMRGTALPAGPEGEEFREAFTAMVSSMRDPEVRAEVLQPVGGPSTDIMGGWSPNVEPWGSARQPAAAPASGAQAGAPQMSAPQMSAPQMGDTQMIAAPMGAPQMGTPQASAPQAGGFMGPGQAESFDFKLGGPALGVPGAATPSSGPASIGGVPAGPAAGIPGTRAGGAPFTAGTGPRNWETERNLLQEFPNLVRLFMGSNLGAAAGGGLERRMQRFMEPALAASLMGSRSPNMGVEDTIRNRWAGTDTGDPGALYDRLRTAASFVGKLMMAGAGTPGQQDVAAALRQGGTPAGAEGLEDLITNIAAQREDPSFLPGLYAQTFALNNTLTGGESQNLAGFLSRILQYRQAEDPLAFRDQPSKVLDYLESIFGRPASKARPKIAGG